MTPCDALERLKGVNVFADRPTDALDHAAFALILAAARRVAEAPEGRVCEAHDSGNALGFQEKCDAYEAMLLNGTPFTNHCRMVRKLLVDPDNL